MNQREREVLNSVEDLKDTLENELINQQKENKAIKIKDVKFVGQISWKDKINGQELSENVFIVEKEIIEKDESGAERVTEQTNYYLGDKCIGGTIGDNTVVFGQDFQMSEPDKVNAVNELLEETSEQEIEANSLNNLNKKEMAEVLTAHLGKKVSEEEAEKMIQEMDKDEIEELKNEKDEKGEDILSEKQTENIKVNGIQKADLNKLVDGKETLGKRLDLEGYDSLYVVYSEKVNDITADSKINNTTYSLVGMTKEGKAKVLNDEFEMDNTVGNNASREQTKIRANGIATRDNKDLSVYTRKSNGTSVGLENNQGNVDMFMYQKTLEENENIGVQIETSKTPIIPIETREVMNRNKGMYQGDKVQDEIEGHTEEKCEPDNAKDFDGMEDTATHEHIVENEIDGYVSEIFNYENEYGEEKIKEVFTENEVKDKLLRELRENKNTLSTEQIVENVKEEMNRDAEMFEREHKM